MKLYDKAIKRFNDGILLNTLYQRMHIRKTGLIPFYLVREGFSDEGVPAIEPKISSLKLASLTPQDFISLAKNPECDYTEEKMLKMHADGCVCLGVHHKNEIAAYTWYDLNQCSYKFLRFDLADDEAYLFSARTFKAYRGKALAPYLRKQVYEHLAAMGRTKLFSVTLYENTPSIMFKKKLNARNLKLYLHVRTFKKHGLVFLLRQYE